VIAPALLDERPISIVEEEEAFKLCRRRHSDELPVLIYLLVRQEFDRHRRATIPIASPLQRPWR
jgi:hypothetical protein